MIILLECWSCDRNIAIAIDESNPPIGSDVSFKSGQVKRVECPNCKVGSNLAVMLPGDDDE